MRRSAIVAAWVALLSMSHCVSAEEAFVDGRLERLCSQSIPVCGVQASCILNEASYIDSAFPGGQRFLVDTAVEASTLRIRIFLTQMLHPGTELVIQANDPDCATFDEVSLVDVDLFAVAGDDRVFEYELELFGRGDHLVEIFSDMSADYLLTVDVLEQ